MISSPGFRFRLAMRTEKPLQIVGAINANHTLMAKMTISENPQFSKDYLDPEKRSISNSLTVELNDGTVLDEVIVEYPIGHKRRREEALPQLIKKFKVNLGRRFPAKQQNMILDVSLDYSKFINMSVDEYVDLMVI